MRKRVLLLFLALVLFPVLSWGAVVETVNTVYTGGAGYGNIMVWKVTLTWDGAATSYVVTCPKPELLRERYCYYLKTIPGSTPNAWSATSYDSFSSFDFFGGQVTTTATSTTLPKDFLIDPYPFTAPNIYVAVAMGTPDASSTITLYMYYVK